MIVFQRVSKSSSIFVPVLIGAIAIGLSIASYQYSVFTSEEIRKIGAQDLRSNAEIQAHDIARNLKNNIESVHSNLALLSNIPAIQNKDLESAKELFSDAQETTSNILLPATFGLTKMEGFYGPTRLKIRQYMSSM